MNNESKKTCVQSRYGQIAREGSSSCCASSSCCGESSSRSISSKIGYTKGDMAEVPDGANLGLGCGNPTALAGIRPGETVVDLGSGAGFDCFLAAARVGPEGRVIGVDMTADMISRARKNAEKAGHNNVEFRLGEIEHLPMADSSVDLVISNCVINLSTDKPSVFAEAYRILKPGGRLMVSDIVLDGELPEEVLNNCDAYSACISGAVKRDEYIGMVGDAGFEKVDIATEATFSDNLVVQAGNEKITVPEGVLVSISLSAVKP